MIPTTCIVAALLAAGIKPPPGIEWEIKTPIAWYVSYVGSGLVPVLASNLAWWRDDPLYMEVVQDAAGAPVPGTVLQACIDAAKATCMYGVKSVTFVGGETPSCTFECFAAPAVPAKPPNQAAD